MSISFRGIVGVVRHQLVREQLTQALQGADVTWQGDDTVRDLIESVKEGRLFEGAMNRGEVRHWRPLSSKIQKDDDAQRWFDEYMPPIAVCHSLARMGWRILAGEPGRVIDGSAVRRILTKGAKRLIVCKEFAKESQLLYEPAQYPSLLPLNRSRSWLALQLISHRNRKRINYCESCQRHEWERFDTIDSCVAVVTGIDREVVQADWQIYRGTSACW